ncbi:unnamed protein product [Amaranthus hypochondriacus]
MESSSESYSPPSSSLPTSSSSLTSSHSSPVAPNFASLLIMAIKDKIVEKIMYNRVTLIIGETGCETRSQKDLCN